MEFKINRIKTDVPISSEKEIYEYMEKLFCENQKMRKELIKYTVEEEDKLEEFYKKLNSL